LDCGRMDASGIGNITASKREHNNESGNILGENL
jgi:hypothetical protein